MGCCFPSPPLRTSEEAESRVSLGRHARGEPRQLVAGDCTERATRWSAVAAAAAAAAVVVS
eukprot:COSAG02_NODE_1040_length_15035_cov_198.613819_9_plen_61_part_00